MTSNYFSATAIGLFVTVALFWVMDTLIRLQPLVLQDPPHLGTLTFTRLIEERPVETVDPRQRFDELKEPVEPTPRLQSDPTSGESLAVRLTPTASRPMNKLDPIGAAVQDGPLVSMVRVGAMYPPRAAELGLEGHVVLQFDVTATGHVTNVTVVESSHRLFEKPAVDAIAKFRFRARVIDGQPQPTYGVRNLFRFEIDDG